MKNKILQTENFLIVELAKIVHRDRKIFYFVTLLCIIFAYTYNTKFSQVEFTTTVNINGFSKDKFLDLVDGNEAKSISEVQVLSQKLSQEFNELLVSNIGLLKNLDTFVYQKKDINLFKNYLKKNYIDVEDYFQTRFGNPLVDRKKVISKFFLIYNSTLDGRKFLDEYIQYCFELTKNEYLSNLIKLIETKIKINKQSASIAEKINLNKPLAQNFANNDSNMSIIVDPDKIFRGAIILNEEVKIYENLLETIKNNDGIFKNSYNFFSKPTKPARVSKSLNQYLLLGFFVGLIFSIIIIVSRQIFFIKR